MENAFFFFLHRLNKLTFSSCHFDKGLRSRTVSEINLNAQCRNSLVSKKKKKKSLHNGTKPSCDLRALSRLLQEKKQLLLFCNIRGRRHSDDFDVLTVDTTLDQSADELQTDGSPLKVFSCSNDQQASLLLLKTFHFISFSQAAGGGWGGGESCAFHDSHPQQIYLLCWWHNRNISESSTKYVLILFLDIMRQISDSLY